MTKPVIALPAQQWRTLLRWPNPTRGVSSKAATRKIPPTKQHSKKAGSQNSPFLIMKVPHALPTMNLNILKWILFKCSPPFQITKAKQGNIQSAPLIQWKTSKENVSNLISRETKRPQNAKNISTTRHIMRPQLLRIGTWSAKILIRYLHLAHCVVDGLNSKSSVIPS